MNPEYCLLSKKQPSVRKNPQQILVFFTFWGPRDALSVGILSTSVVDGFRNSAGYPVFRLNFDAKNSRVSYWSSNQKIEF